jgi:(p)ppGpp synthase/HD superfamily hydrolase
MDMNEWILEQHSSTNHMYDTYLPYEFHLRMVAHIAKKYSNLLDDEVDYFTGKKEYDRGRDATVTLRTACLRAAWGHDLIEDTRVSYNVVKQNLGQEAADIIYALTNEKGKNRKERANDKYYEGIRNTPGAVFVKLCDRIANAQYSKMTGSRMFEMYKKENNHFLDSLGFVEGHGHPLGEMCHYLENLFED